MEAATRQLIVIVIFPNSFQLVEREPGNPSLSASKKRPAQAGFFLLAEFEIGNA